MGAMSRAIDMALKSGAIRKVGEKNRQAMFGSGQKPSDYQQGPTASQNFGIKAGGVASPDMELQYQKYLQEEKRRRKKTTETKEGKTLLS